MDENNPMLFVRCELCGEKVRRGRIEEHERVVHRRGKRVVTVSADFDDCFDEESLRQRLGQALGVRVRIERRGDWGLSAVPTIRADGPWSGGHRDAYWRAFTCFCRWPAWKENARLEVYDSNPTLGRIAVKRIVIFYRGDLRRLSMWVKLDNETLARTKVLDGVSLQQLCTVNSFEDALLM